MSTNEHDDYVHDEHGPPRRWLRAIHWSGLCLIGWIIYELTMQPALAAGAVCVKFGWEDFRTAVWLRRHDPKRTRGKACAAFYFASGLWKIILTSFVMFVALAIVTDNPGAPPQPGQPPPPVPPFVLPFVICWLGFWILAVALCRSLWLALRYRVRFWLNPVVHLNRQFNLWPPGQGFSHRRNRAGLVLMSSLFVMVFPVLVLVVIVLFTVVLEPLGQGRHKGLITVGSILLSVVVGPIGFIGLKAFLYQRVIAASPEECWGDAELVEIEMLPEHDYQVSAD
jgi:hypothetical protein